MAGRGALSLAPEADPSDALVLRNGRWVPLFRPIHTDRSAAGFCLGETFAEDYRKDHRGVMTGLIPCADGGTMLEQWQVGGLLFDNAVCQAKLALRTSHITAVLWHQGESNTKEGKPPYDKAKLASILYGFREALGLYDVPFLIGGLSPDLGDTVNGVRTPWKRVEETNCLMASYADETPHTGFVTAERLTTRPDHHFETDALIAFGHRYYDVFRALEDRARIFEEKPEPDNAVRPREVRL